jgi:cell wall-associated NlpC family hydrolase
LPATLAPHLRHARTRSTTGLLVLLLTLLGVAATPGTAFAATSTHVALSVNAPTVAYGARGGINVRLRNSANQPVPHRWVTLQQHESGDRWSTITRARVDAYGRAFFAPVMRRSTMFRVVHPGDATYAGSSNRTTIRVSSTLGSRAVAEAKRHYGKHYQWGAAGPHRFDCSGFTMYVFGRLGRSLPHSSGAQSQSVRRVANSSKQVGDLIFTWTNGRVTHVGIYAGNNTMWAATKSGDIVRTQTLYSRNYTVGRVA